MSICLPLQCDQIAKFFFNLWTGNVCPEGSKKLPTFLNFGKASQNLVALILRLIVPAQIRYR